MASLVFEENYKIYFVPTIVDIAAPTTAEIAAGTDITPYVTKDGVNPGISNNRVPSGTIDTAFDAEEPGSWGSALSLTGEKDDTDDAFFDLFVRGTRGNILIGWAGGVAADDPAYVWPVAAMSPELPASAANTKQTVTTPFTVTSPPDFRAVIAAGA